MVCRWPPMHLFSGCRTQLHVSSLACPGAITCVLPWSSCTGCQWCTESSSSWHWWCSIAQTTWPILHNYSNNDPACYWLRLAIGTNYSVARRRTKFGDRAFSWPGQSCGTVCQRQFVMRKVYTLLNADSNRTFLACVLMIDIQCNALGPVSRIEGTKLLSSTSASKTRISQSVIFTVY